MESREKARINYLQIIGQYPLLPYLSSPDPKDEEIVSALNQMKVNGQKMLSSYIEKDPLELMGLTGFVDEFLAENPQFCETATGLWGQYRNKQRAYLPLEIAGSIAGMSACGLFREGFGSPFAGLCKGVFGQERS